MTLGLDHGADLEQRVAVLAVGVAGVAVDGAGRFLRVAQLGLGVVAIRVRILQRDVIDRSLVALGVLGAAVVEGEADVLLAIEHGNGDLGGAGLVQQAVDRQLGGIPDRVPAFAVIRGGLDSQVDLAGLERVAAQRVVKGQDGALAAQVDGRADEVFALAVGIRPILVVVGDHGDGGGVQCGQRALFPRHGAGRLGGNAPATGREVGVFKVVCEVNAGNTAGDLEARLNGVRALGVFEGVARDRTDGGAVDQHVADLIAEQRGDSIGLALTFLDVGTAGRGDRAALTRRGGDLGIALDVGLNAGGLELHVVDRRDTGGILTGGLDIVPADQHIAGAQRRGDGDKRAVCRDIGGGGVADGVLRVPQGRPRAAAVGRDLDGEGHLAALDRVVREGIVKFEVRVGRAHEVDGRRDQALVLIAAFIIGDVSGLGLVEIVVAVALPRCGGGVADLPALGRELLGLEVLLKEHLGRFGDELKARLNIVVLVDVFHRVGRGLGDAAAVDTVGGEAVAAVRRCRQGEAAAVWHALRAARRNAAALGGSNIDRMCGAAGCFAEGHINRMLHADHFEGVVADGTEILAVHHKGGNLVALVRDRGKGLGRALADQNSAGGGQRAVRARGGVDGNVVLGAVLIDLHIAEAVGRAALGGGVDKGEADIRLALIGIGDDDLGLRVRPVGVKAGVMQVPDGFPVRAVIRRDVDVNIEVRVLDAEGVAGVEGEDHVRGRALAGQIIGRRVEPLVLIDLVAVDACEHILVAHPALDGVTLGLDRPAVGQPLALEVLGIEHHIVGDLNIGVVVGVVLGAEIKLTGVARVVVNGQTNRLAVAGDVDVLQDGGRARRVLADTDGLVDLAVLRVGQDDGGDVLVVRQGDCRIVAALGLADGHIQDLRHLGIDRDGERPRIAEVCRRMLVIDRRGRDGDRRLGIIRKIKAVLVRAVPRVDCIAVVGEGAGRGDLIGAGIIDGLRLVVDGLFIVDRAVLAGDLVGQRSGRAEHAGVDPRQGVEEIVVVRGNGIAVSQIRDGVVVVVLAEVGVHGLFHGLEQRLVVVGLRVGLLGLEGIPPEAGVDDRGLRPVAVEGKERSAQVDAVGLHRAVGVGGLQNGPALDKCTVDKLRKVLLRIGQGDGDDDFLLAMRRNDDQIVFHIGREGAGQEYVLFGHENVAVLVLLRAVGENERGCVIIQRAVAGVVHRELQLIHAGLGHVVAKLHLRAVHTGNGDVALGLDGRVDVHQTGALTARGNGRVLVIDDARRAHEQGVNQMLALRGVHIGVLRLDRLRNDRHAAGHVRRGHGRAGHQLIGALAGNRGIDVAAGCCDLRLERQLGGRAPRGKIAHTGNRRGHKLVGNANGQVLVLLLGKISAVLLGDERNRNFPRANGHIDDARLVVVNDHGDSTGGRRVIRLGLVVQTAAALHNCDLALDIYLLEVLRRAVAADHDVLQAALVGNGAQRPGSRNLLRIGIVAVIVGNIALTDGDIRRDHAAVFDGRNGEGFIVGRRLGNVAVVRVGGQRLAAVVILIGRRIGVAGGDRHGDAALADAIKDVNQVGNPFVLRFILNETAVRAEGHVD